MAKLTVVVSFKTEGQQEAERAAQSLAKAYPRLAASLSPVVAQQIKMERAQRTLDNALKKGKITQEEYNRLLALAKTRYMNAADGSGLFRRTVEDMTASFGRMAVAAAAALGALALVTLGKSLKAWEEEAKAVRQLEAALASTGNAAGRTVAQLQAQASALQRATETADDAILVAQSQMLTFTKVSGQVFDRAIESVLDLSVRMDQDLRTSVIAVGKALNDPVRGLGSLARAGIQFTDQQKEMVKALVESGDLVGAQTIILKELETQFGGSAKAARDAGSGLIPLQNAAGDLLELIGAGLAPAVRDLAGDLEDMATDPATVEFFRDLGQSAGSLLSVLKIVTGQLSDFSIGWLKVRTDALATLALIREHVGNLAETLSRAPSFLKIAALGPEGAKALDQYAEAADRIAGETGKAARQAALDLAAALTGLKRSGKEAGEGLDTASDSAGTLGRTADQVKEALKDLKAELSEHEKAVREAEKAIQEAQKHYREYAGAIDEAREALGDLDAIGLAEWVEENLSIPLSTTEQWQNLAESIALVEAALEDLSGRGPISLDVEAELNGMVLPGVDPEHLEKMQQEYRETIGRMSVELEAMMKRAWENVQDIAADAIGDTFKEWLRTGNDTLDRFLGAVIDMLAQMIVVWLANIALRLKAELAAAATARAAWAAASATGGGGGGGGFNWSSLLGLFGGGGGGGGAITGLNPSIFGTAIPTTTAPSSSTSLMAGGALGALAIVGVTAAFAYWAHTEAAKKAAKRWFGVAEVREGWSAMFGSVEVLQFTTAIRDKVREIFAVIGGELSSLPEITVDVQATGKQFRSFVDGALVGYFRTFEEAFQAAALQAIEQSDLSRMIPEIAAALQAGTINSLEQLSGVADVFERILSVTSPVTLQVSRFLSELEVMRQTLVDAGIAASALAEYTALGWASIRASITGATADAEKLFELRMEEFNRERERERAKQEAAKAAADASYAAAQAEVARLTALIAGLQALAVLSEKQAQMLAGFVTNLATAEALLLASAAAAAAAQAAIDALPEPIKPSEFRRPGAGGGGASQAEQDAERVADAIVQIARSLMKDLARALAELDAKYEDLTQAARNDAAALARLIELREQEKQLLIDQAVTGFYGKLLDFESVGGSALDDALRDINQGAQALRQEGREIGKALNWTAERIRTVMDRINAAAQAQREALLQGAGQELILSMLDFLGKGEEAERMRFEIQKAQLLIAYEELKIAAAKYEIEVEFLSQLGELVGELKDFDFEDFRPAPGGGGGGDNVDEEFRRRVAEALNKLKEIQARSLSPFEQAIRSVVDEFAELRQVLGWTTELQALYAQELRRVIAEQVAAVTRMREELIFRSDSPERTEEQFRLAQQQANEAAAALAAGDFSQLDRIPDLVNRVLELRPNAQASEGSRFLLAWADKLLADAAKSAEEAALAIEPGGPNDPFAWLRTTPTAGDTAVVDAIRDLGARQDRTTDAITRTAARDSLAEAMRDAITQMGRRETADRLRDEIEEQRRRNAADALHGTVRDIRDRIPREAPDNLRRAR